jgi:hypothetical protein
MRYEGRELVIQTSWNWDREMRSFGKLKVEKVEDRMIENLEAV